MPKCKLCGSKLSAVFHEIESNEYVCDKCFYGKEYREELYNKAISEYIEAMLKQYAEWEGGIYL